MSDRNIPNDRRNGDDMAFPCDGPNVPAYGLTKREYIAAMALQGFLASLNGEAAYNDVAADAVGYADALLAALRVSENNDAT